MRARFCRQVNHEHTFSVFRYFFDSGSADRLEMCPVVVVPVTLCIYTPSGQLMACGTDSGPSLPSIPPSLPFFLFFSLVISLGFGERQPWTWSSGTRVWRQRDPWPHSVSAAHGWVTSVPCNSQDSLPEIVTSTCSGAVRTQPGDRCKGTERGSRHIPSALWAAAAVTSAAVLPHAVPPRWLFPSKRQI